jgi:hypothetical protein
VVVLFIALLIAAPSFQYPFGRDQALFAYGGRVWLEGLLPYRDFFDSKPPGVFALHAATYATFGNAQWTIRVVDAATVFACGWMAALAFDPKKQAPAVVPAAAGVMTLGWYFAAFDYWDSAQSESGQAFWVVLGWLLLAKGRANSWWAAAVGACLGFAFLFKMSIATYAVPFAYALSPLGASRRDGWGRSLERLGFWAAGGLGVVGVCLGYFALQGGLVEVFEVLVGYVMHYSSHFTLTWPEAQIAIGVFVSKHLFPGTFLIAFGAVAVTLVDRRRSGAPLWCATDVAQILVWVAAVAAVAIQRKFFTYHWGVLLAPVALSCGRLVMFFAAAPARAVLVSCGAVLTCLAFCPPWPTNSAVNTLTHLKSVVARLSGELDREAYLDQFRGGYGYRYLAQETIGKVLATRAAPGDQVLVEGFEPTIYQVSGLLSPTRFPASHFLVDQRMDYNRAEWRAQYVEALAKSPPRFVVLMSRPRSFFGTRQLFRDHSYRRVLRHGRFKVYDREGMAVAP